MAPMPLILPYVAPVQPTGPVPNFFIANTGNDANPGTLSSPCSLSILNNANARNTYPNGYAGATIGIIGGTTASPVTYTQVNPGTVTSLSAYFLGTSAPSGGVGCCFQVQGGTASSPTYITSCDARGNYAPRSATIDLSQGGSQNAYIGHLAALGQANGGGNAAPTQWGYVTIDGIAMTQFVNYGIAFVNSTTPLNGVITNNNHLYSCSTLAYSNDNPAAIWRQGCVNPIALNNKVHDLVTNGPTNNSQFAPYGGYGIFDIGGPNVSNPIVKWNTIYNIGNAYAAKDCYIDGTSGEIAYNYLDAGVFGVAPTSVSSIKNLIADTGATVLFHHNICTGLIDCVDEAGLAGSKGQVTIYNNSITQNSSGLWVIRSGVDNTTPGNFTLYNNVVYPITSNAIGANFNSSAVLGMVSNYNVVRNVTKPFAYENITELTAAQWQAAPYSQDINSALITVNPFNGGAGPTSASGVPNIVSWSILGSAVTASGQGGAVPGALNLSGTNMAQDGTGQIGCNF